MNRPHSEKEKQQHKQTGPRVEISVKENMGNIKDNLEENCAEQEV